MKGLEMLKINRYVLLLLLATLLVLPAAALTEISSSDAIVESGESGTLIFSVGGIDHAELIAFDLSFDPSIIYIDSNDIRTEVANASVLSNTEGSILHLALLSTDPKGFSLKNKTIVVKLSFKSLGKVGRSDILLQNPSWTHEFSTNTFDRIQNGVIIVQNTTHDDISPGSGPTVEEMKPNLSVVATGRTFPMVPPFISSGPDTINESLTSPTMGAPSSSLDRTMETGTKEAGFFTPMPILAFIIVFVIFFLHRFRR